MYLVVFQRLMCGMVTVMAIQGGAPRALRLAQRMDHLGIPARDLAFLAKVDPESVARAREGKARPSTFGKLERALDEFEHETGADQSDDAVATIEMPDGTRVTYRGVSAEDAAKFVTDFLAGRDESSST